jgi:carbon storage regulator CsrA
MLVLSRNDGEIISLTHPDGTRIEIKVQNPNHGRVRLCISAPQTIRVMRTEIEDKEKQ